jgi:hypothetical protein
VSDDPEGAASELCMIVYDRRCKCLERCTTFIMFHSDVRGRGEIKFSYSAGKPVNLHSLYNAKPEPDYVFVHSMLFAAVSS